MNASIDRRLFAEGLGTAMLLVVVVGSGIMGEKLAGGNVAIALLANSIATGAGLVALIMTLGPVSGAHFNPVVSMVAALSGDLSWREAFAYMLVQCLAAFAGVAMAHGMFDLPVFSASQHVRTGPSQWGSEVLATFGLLMVILGCVKHRAGAVPYAVGAYIAGAYWFTSSTSFANPAVTLARAATDTFAGIRPDDAPAFIAAQLAGALFALYVMRWLLVESKD
jgi:glycerol uptake facilitator-like aquaporin